MALTGGASLGAHRTRKPSGPRTTRSRLWDAACGARARCGRTAGRSEQPGGRSRRLRRTRERGRRRRGTGPAVPPAPELIRRGIRSLTGRGAPAAHHRFPEQCIHAHCGRPGITTAAIAKITGVTAVATITDRPFHDAGRSIPRSLTAAPL